MEVEKETPIWYAMRATYRREPDAMRLLEKEKLGCFVPMQYKISIKKGKKVRVLVPVIHNLLFVHACPSEVKRIKSQVTYLQYITDTRSGQKIIISDSEMQRFIAVAGTYNDHLMYFQPDELNLSKGTKVRITGGDFEGQEGIFLKVKGARDRRVDWQDYIERLSGYMASTGKQYQNHAATIISWARQDHPASRQRNYESEEYETL